MFAELVGGWTPSLGLLVETNPAGAHNVLKIIPTIYYPPLESAVRVPRIYQPGALSAGQSIDLDA